MVFLVGLTISTTLGMASDYPSNYFLSNTSGQFSIRRASSASQLEAISSAEVKLIKVATKASPSLSPHLLTSFAIEENYAKKLEGTSKLESFVEEKSKEINVTVFYQSLLTSIKVTKDDLAKRRKERTQQTNISYYASLVCLILGVLLVFIGVILIFVGKIEGGILTTISSVVSSVVSGLAFVFNKQTNNAEHEEVKELKNIERVYNAMGIISCVTEVKIRDELMQKLVETHYFDK